MTPPQALPRIYSARYLYPGRGPAVEGGALLDCDGKIAAVGTLKELKRQNPAVEVTDFGESLLVPVLVNAHTHLELTDYPQWAEEVGETDDPSGFVDWILRLIRVKRPLKAQLYQQSVATGIEKSIAAGTGAVGDILSHYPSRKAYQGSLLRGVLFLESLGQDPGVIQRVKAGLTAVLKERQAGQLPFGISPHSPYSISSNYLAYLYKLCQDENFRCATHLAESAAEVEFIEKSRGELITGLYLNVGWETLIPKAANCTPTEYIQQRGGLFPQNLLVHGVQLTSAEIKLLAEQGMALALCPRSNERLNVGKAPAGELLRAGVRLCLGTDSLASNTTLSIWDEMAFAADWFAGELDAPTLFQLATTGGAEVLGLADELGSLSVGKESSFQVLQLRKPVPTRELADYLVAPGRTEEITQVYLQGQAQLSGFC